jgi:solute carrier family 40 (iron-regulated transporter), member 1
MRRIDLLCKLIGPLAISLILVTLGLSVASIGVEYFAIAQVITGYRYDRGFLTNLITSTKVYQRVPALQLRNSANTRDNLSHQGPFSGAAEHPLSDSIACLRRNLSSLMLYCRHRDFLPSMALSLLYFTVLSFGGQMVTYLLSVGYTSTQIGIIRTVSVVAEVSATWLGPVLMRRVGVIRAGLWSISWQLFCITAAVTLFLAARQPVVAASLLITGVIGSRVGLWMFDLCVQTIVQEVRASSFSLCKANHGRCEGGRS